MAQAADYWANVRQKAKLRPLCQLTSQGFWGRLVAMLLLVLALWEPPYTDLGILAGTC